MRKFLIPALVMAGACLAAAEPEVGITFVPPPLEGTISLGIYAAGGTLIRTLRTEADPEKDFTAGLNGLILKWDGQDDAGHPAPAGTYTVRGYGVGALAISGEAYHGNDWITAEDSPRVTKILGLKALSGGRLQVRAECLDGKTVTLQSDVEGKTTLAAEEPEAPASGHGLETVLPGGAGSLPEVEKPVDACLGVNGSIWVIDTPAEGPAVVKQYSAQREFQRRLAIAPGEPVPQQIAASPTEERLYLLEGAPGWQRVRGLSLQATTPVEGEPATSTWQAFLTRSIRVAESFAAFAPQLGRPDFRPEGKLKLRLVPNPLLQETPGQVEVSLAVDEKGSYLRTADGLRLLRLTDTPRLKWAVMGREGKGRALTVFQSDGAVVEEFRVKQPANLMSFEAGEYELKR